MNRDEAIEKIAKELYEWSGRFGYFDGRLWRELGDFEKQPYLKEAKFILSDTFPFLALVDREAREVLNPYRVEINPYEHDIYKRALMDMIAEGYIKELK